MAEYTALAPLFTDIANAIRSKTGETGQITANQFPDKITSIPVFSLNPYNQTNVSKGIIFLGWIYNDYTTSADPKLSDYLDVGKTFSQGIVSIWAESSTNSYLTKTFIIACEQKDYLWNYIYGSGNDTAYLSFSVIKDTDSYRRITYGFSGNCYYLTSTSYRNRITFYTAIILSF